METEEVIKLVDGIYKVSSIDNVVIVTNALNTDIEGERKIISCCKLQEWNCT